MGGQFVERRESRPRPGGRDCDRRLRSEERMGHFGAFLVVAVVQEREW